MRMSKSPSFQSCSTKLFKALISSLIKNDVRGVHCEYTKFDTVKAVLKVSALLCAASIIPLRSIPSNCLPGWAYCSESVYSFTFYHLDRRAGSLFADERVWTDTEIDELAECQLSWV